MKVNEGFKLGAWKYFLIVTEVKYYQWGQQLEGKKTQET